MTHDVSVQIFHDGQWNTVPAEIWSGPVTITRGGNDGQAPLTPSQIITIIDNDDNAYNPEHPESPLYGKIGRGTRIRAVVGTPSDVSEGFEDSTLDITITPGGNAPWARASDHAHTGSWSLKSGTITVNQTSDAVVTVPAGAVLVSFWYRVSSRQNLDFFRVLLDNELKINISGEVEWTQALFDVRNVDTITLRYARSQFSPMGSDAAWVDDMLFVGAETRGTGEIEKWQPQYSEGWPAVGHSWVSVTGNGILNRLLTDNERVISPMRREALAARTIATVAAYWPCEDDASAQQLASGLPDSPAMTLLGNVTPASYSGIPGSAPIATFGSEGNFSAHVPPNVDTTGSQWWHITLHVPDTVTTPNGTILFNLYQTGGNVHSIAIDYETLFGGSVRVIAVDQAFNVITETAAVEAFPADGRLELAIGLEQNGSDVDVIIQRTRIFDDRVDVVITPDTLTGITLGRCWRITGGGSGQMNGWAFGHMGLATTADWLKIVESAPTQFLLGHTGETAGQRLQRLTRENNVPFLLIGDPIETPLMGPQPIDTLINIIGETVRTDAGLLFEPRAAVALGYRTRRELFRQAPALELAWEQIMHPFVPVIDNRDRRNDVTVHRRNGSSARAVRRFGPLNVNDPADDPQGIGSWPARIQVNPRYDEELASLAAWYLHLGTVPGARYPQVTISLDRNPELAVAVSRMEIGDRIVITGAPTKITPNPIDLLYLGETESAEKVQRTITFNCVPAAPYRIAVWDDPDSRRDTRGSVTVGDFEAGTDTSLVVATLVGEPWTTRAASIPFVVEAAGVRLRVTAVSGTSSPQTFTVDQEPVNGVHKTVPSGSAVSLAEPVYWGW